MNRNKGPIHSPVAPESVWNQVGSLIKALWSDKTWDNPDLPQVPEDGMPVTGEHMARFFTALRRWTSVPRRAQESTLVEKWTIEQQQQNWLARAWKAWKQASAEIRQAGSEFRSMAVTLESIFTRVSQHLVPAPAYRDATATREYVYQPRRRAIEPADLPVFSPLFCTSVEPDAKTYTITGLPPHKTYRFCLISVQDHRIRQDFTLTSSLKGKLELDLARWILSLQEKQGGSSDFAWFLQEIQEGESLGDHWASGLVWLEPESVRRQAGEIKRVLDQASGTAQDHSRLGTFLELNWTASRGAYIKAYEQARRDLLFFSHRYWDENPILYKEALWQFIHALVTQMVERLARAESTFLAQKPDWKALEALRTLENRLVEWD